MRAKKPLRLPPWDITLLTLILWVLGYAAVLNGFHHPAIGARVVEASGDPLSLPSVPVRYDFLRDTPPLQSPFQAGTIRDLRVPILMYHHVGPLPPDANAIRRGLTVSTEDFTAQLDWLRSEGYTSISLRDLYLALAYGDQLPARPVVFTFDDGYRDNVEVALPLLRSHGFRATFFVITAMRGGPDYMTWEELAAAQREGFEIESHTLSHVDLSLARGAALDQQLVAPRTDLANRLGTPAYFLCYPSGQFDALTEQRTQAAGYLMAVTTQQGLHQRSDKLLEEPRVRVAGGESLAKFIEALQAP